MINSNYSSEFKIRTFICLAFASMIIATRALAAATEYSDETKGMQNNIRNDVRSVRSPENIVSQASPQTVPPIPPIETKSPGATFDTRTNKINTGIQPDVETQKFSSDVQNPQKSPIDFGAKTNSQNTNASTGTSTILNETNRNKNPEQTQTATDALTQMPTHENVPMDNTDPKGQTESLPDNPQLNLPNGAALQTQLVPFGQTETSPWKTIFTGGTLILAIAAAGVLAVRVKNGRNFAPGRSEKQLQLLTSMSLSPKRQILLVRIRDREVALASTEHGITLLTEMQHNSKKNLALVDDTGNEENRRKVNKQLISDAEPHKLVAAHTNDDGQNVGNETAIARSEMLMNALKNLRDKNVRKSEASPAPKSEMASAPNFDSELPRGKLSSEPSVIEKTKSESTMRQTRATFPKYLANAFEAESKRTLNQGQTSNQATTDEANSVTNLIKERLKDLRPLS